jgi:hypothetical protein
MRNGLRTQQKEKSDPAKEIRITKAINRTARVEITGKGMDMERVTERDMISTISIAPTSAGRSKATCRFFGKR